MTGELQQGLHEEAVIGGSCEVLDKSPVDFKHINGEQPHVAERGMPRAEIVDGDARTEFLDALDQGPGSVDILDQRGLGNLDDQPLRHTCVQRELRPEGGHPVWMQRGGDADVHGQHDITMLAQGLKREFQDAMVNQMQETQPLRDRHDLGCAEPFALGRDHADQRFIHRDVARRRGDDRLKGEPDAAIVERGEHNIG